MASGTQIAAGGWETRLHGLLERPGMRRAILALILINAVILSLETSPRIMAGHGPLLAEADLHAEVRALRREIAGPRALMEGASSPPAS